MSSFIKIRGAREHNLKNIDVDIPREKLVVISGLSGSGKSSLAFDTIYAEGQRRYVESLSAYARQFLGQLEKPDVDSIEGLSPAISIEQKTTHRNPRSTVGTVTEIYDYVRLILARIGEPHCPVSGKKLEAQSVDTIVDRIFKMPQKHNCDKLKIQILAPVLRSKKGELKDLFLKLQKEGFVRVRVDNKIYNLGDEIKMVKNQKHDVEIVVDRLVIENQAANQRNKEIQTRLTDSVETALKHGNRQIIVMYEGDKDQNGEDFFSSKLYSPDADEDFPEITHRLFSFNSPEGACSSCSGLGFHLEIHPDLLIKDKDAVIENGLGDGLGWSNDAFWYKTTINALADAFHFKVTDRWSDLPPKTLDKILYGDDTVKLKYNWQGNDSSYQFSRKHEGFIRNIMRRYESTNSEVMRQRMEQYMINMPCKECKGARLNKWALNVFFQKKNIQQLTQMSIEACLDFFASVQLTKNQQIIADQALKEILSRLKFLNDVGVGYLTLDRIAGSLSGGEAQRIRLATQIGSALMGVLYVLDEPSIGLHQCDNERLIKTLKDLRDLGNTVIVVEHDEDTLRECDYIVDVGPKAGIHGGEVVFQGSFSNLLKDKKSTTAAYLNGTKKIEVPKQRRPGTGKYISITGASENNLKDVSVDIPLGQLICVTGVSGSGKSTLINQILYRALFQKLNGSGELPGKHKSISGTENIDKIIDIDQSAIGRTPRSNPATYTGAFTPIRDLFAQLPASKMKGYAPGRFSFNVKGGRCEACEGDGVKKIEMHFLSDVFITCEVCDGRRYNRETLEVKFKNHSIHDVLQLSVAEGAELFASIPAIAVKLRALNEVGLGYIKLGQAATTLSGGEAQRVKLATELSKRSTSKTFYILDEPTTGLHFEDINQLLKILHRFVDEGNTVLVIEHNMDVIKTADHIIDLGPEGGQKGGRIIAEGTPEAVAKNKESKTGLFLKRWLMPR